MKNCNCSPKFAKKTAGLVCSLAVTLFLACSWQAGAQSAAATVDNRSSADGHVMLGGHTPRKVKDGTAVLVDHYNPQNKLRLAIFVTPHDLAGQEKLIADLQDKNSPNFHKWLTADEWNARFGPRVEEEQAVVDWAKSQGLTITNRFANRMIVDVEAESGTIEKALNITINHYKVGNEVDFSNDRDPSIPQSLSGIVGGIFGLTSIERMKPADSRHTEARHPDYVPGPVFSTKISGHGDGDPSKAPWAQASGIGKGGDARRQAVPVSHAGSSDPNPPNELGGINPSNLYSSQGYDLGPLMALSQCCNVHNDSTGSPPDTSIALVTFGGFNYTDYTAFTTYYGMAWNIDAYQIDGAGTTATTDCQIDVSDVSSSCPGDGLDDEADLDVEWSTAFANSYGSYLNTAHVYVYEGSGNYFSNFFDTWNYVLSDAHAHVISSSYDWTEESFQSADPGWMTGTVDGDAHYIFNALVASGNTLINSSGDQGSTSGCLNANQVFWPTNDPDFLSAGGTTLSLNYDGSFGSETAWVGGTTLKSCQSNGGGGGGGVSQYFSAPSWQSGITYEEMYNGGNYIVSGQTNRMLPDMSLNATGNFQWDYCTTLACQNDGADGWSTWGGTSIVAPELAGFFVQVNSYLNAIGHICGAEGTSACEPIGNPDPTLYHIGTHAGDTNYEQHYPFYDTDQLCVTNYLTAQNPDLLYFCATPGYDLATGWGSANLLQLAWAFNWWTIPSYGAPAVTFNDQPTTNYWYNTDQEVSWTVTDGTFSGSTTPAPGVAGFTQGWDSVPADPTSEPNGGTGNAFYSGPQFPLGTTGCLSFNGLNGCASQGVGQGCHTANVRAWDNQGYANTSTYGPVCYDTVAPTVTVSNSPASNYFTWVNTPVRVTLTSADPGGGNASGVYFTAYDVDNPEADCEPGVYGTGCYGFYTAGGGSFTVSTQGQHYIYYFAKDNAGNYSTETYEWVSIDLSSPVTTPTLSGTLSGGKYYSPVQVTLNATDSGGSGIAATYYELDGGAQTTYSGAFTVSTVGAHSVKYWSVNGAGTTASAATTSFTIANLQSTLISPAPGTTFTSTSVTFNWTVASGATGYILHLGSTGVGSSNLDSSGQITGNTVTFSSLPANGETIYARLFTYYGTASVSIDYTYTAITATAAPLTTPAPGSTFTSSTVTFDWTPVTGATKYLLYLGSTGVGSTNLYTSGGTTNTTATATGLPGKGEIVFARLITYFGTTSVNADYIYTDVTQSSLTSPALGNTFTSTTVPFTWTAAAGATKYLLHLGTTGVGSSNVYSSGGITATTATAINLPGNGEPIYVRLYTYWGTAYASTDYTFTDVSQSSLTTPAPGGTLTSTSVTFDWTTAPSATKYLLHLGSTGVGSSNLESSGQISGTTVTFSNLPSNGETIYVRLFTYYGTAYAHTDYTYTALTATPATLTIPAPGSTFTSPTVTFDWLPVTGATKYLLELGTTGVGSSNLYTSGGTTGTTATASNLPGNGETIYARLITYFGTASVNADTTYVDVKQSVLTTPTPGSAFTSTSVTFDWTAATGATKYLLHVGSTGVGSSNLGSSGQITGTTVTFNGLPNNAETIYVRLYTYYGTAYAYTDYTYTAE